MWTLPSLPATANFPCYEKSKQLRLKSPLCFNGAIVYKSEGGVPPEPLTPQYWTLPRVSAVTTISLDVPSTCLNLKEFTTTACWLLISPPPVTTVGLNNVYTVLPVTAFRTLNPPDEKETPAYLSWSSYLTHITSPHWPVVSLSTYSPTSSYMWVTGSPPIFLCGFLILYGGIKD